MQETYTKHADLNPDLFPYISMYSPIMQSYGTWTHIDATVTVTAKAKVTGTGTLSGTDTETGTETGTGKSHRHRQRCVGGTPSWYPLYYWRQLVAF